MIRQYIAFAVVILIAIFIVTQVEWSTLPVPNFGQPDGGQRIERARGDDPANREINFRDLSVGGVSSTSRRQTPETVFSPTEAVTQTTAATSSPVTATSTPFQTRLNHGAYSGVNVQFSKLD
jgi:hypothetical protein